MPERSVAAAPASSTDIAEKFQCNGAQRPESLEIAEFDAFGIRIGPVNPLMKPHIQKSRRLYRKAEPHGRSRFYGTLFAVLCILGFVYLLIVFAPRLAW